METEEKITEARGHVGRLVEILSDLSPEEVTEVARAAAVQAEEEATEGENAKAIDDARMAREYAEQTAAEEEKTADDGSPSDVQVRAAAAAVVAAADAIAHADDTPPDGTDDQPTRDDPDTRGDLTSALADRPPVRDHWYVDPHPFRNRKRSR